MKVKELKEDRYYIIVDIDNKYQNWLFKFDKLEKTNNDIKVRCKEYIYCNIDDKYLVFENNDYFFAGSDNELNFKEITKKEFENFRINYSIFCGLK